MWLFCGMLCNLSPHRHGLMCSYRPTIVIDFPASTTRASAQICERSATCSSVLFADLFLTEDWRSFCCPLCHRWLERDHNYLHGRLVVTHFRQYFVADKLVTYFGKLGIGSIFCDSLLQQRHNSLPFITVQCPPASLLGVLEGRMDRFRLPTFPFISAVPIAKSVFVILQNLHSS